jgi:hypothetical protein
MGEYKVLTLDDSKDWKTYLDGIGSADIFFTPEYCEIFQKYGEGEPRLFIHQEEESYVCYPFLLRKINNLPFYSKDKVEKEYFDIITPYGYGGPITNTNEESERKNIYANFSHIFHEYCLEQGIITEFVRFHPIINNHNDYLAVGPEFNRNTICLDIFLGEGEVENLVSKMRNKVKAAIKNGLSVRVGDKGNLETLVQQYHHTMEKNVAEDYYFFPKEFFYNLVNILDDRNVTLLEVIYEDKVIASTIFLHYNDYVAYFLTGSDQEYLNLRPYNLLMSYAATEFKKEGYKFLHLGGGYSSNDELYRFKKTFTKKDPLDFYIGKRIHNHEVYQDLTKDLNVDANYFPLYRHPSIKRKEEIPNL